MITIFKREFKSHLSNIYGAIFIAVSLAVMGGFVLYTNFLNTVPQIEYGLLGSAIAFIVTIPFLCMFSYYSYRGDGHLKFLFSLPLKTHEIVLGKYFAAVGVLAIPTAVMALVPLLLSTFGGVIFAQSYLSVFAYFLIGATFIAICMFISSQVKHAVGSLCAGILVLLFLYVAPTLIAYLPATPVLSLVCLLALEFAVSLLVWACSKKLMLGAGTLVLSTASTAICYFIFTNDFISLFLRIMNFISPFERFRIFIQGIFRLSDVLYLLSVIVLFVLFTGMTVGKQKHGDVKITRKDPIEVRKRYVRGFKKSLIVSIISIFLIVVLNIGVLAIPAGLTNGDASGLEMYSISKRSKDFAKKLTQDVKIYFLCEEGLPDYAVRSVIEEYDAASSKIKHETVNVSAHPEFTDKYIGLDYNETTDGGVSPLNNHSMIIESSTRYIVIDSASYYHYRIGNQSYSETEFISYSQQLQSSGYSLSALEYKTYFDVDRILASGIEYVVSKSVSTVYTLSGHGEMPISPDFYDNMKYAGVNYAELKLEGKSEMPTNCAALVISSPKTDISKDEADIIINYINEGGDVILITSPDNTEMTNLMSVSAKFGLVPEHGTIKENDAAYYPEGGSQTDLILQANPGHNVVAYLKSQYGSEQKVNPTFPNAHSIVQEGTIDENATITDMLASSNRANLLVNGVEVEKTKEGAFCTASSYQCELENGELSNLIWFGSYEAFSEKTVEKHPTNMLYLLISLSYIGGVDTYETTLKVDSRDISGSFLEIERSMPYIWGVILIAVIPLTVLGTGIAVYVYRRTRKTYRSI